MLKYFATGITFISLFFACDAEEMFTAITHLSTLQKTHKSVVQSLDRYVKMEMKRLRILSKFLIQLKEEQKNMDENLEYMMNPINAFTLINRMTADMRKIEHFTQQMNRFEKPRERFPTIADLEGAAVGMWRLQRTYDLNISQLVAGELSGDFSEDKKPFLEKVSPLTANECFEVGRIAFGERDYESAILWMKCAFKKYRVNAPNNVHLFNEPDIFEYISKSYLKINDVINANHWTERLLEYQKKKGNNNRVSYMQQVDTYATGRQLLAEEKTKYENFGCNKDKKSNKYSNLCRGRINVMTEDKKKRLHCYYKSSPAFLRLARVRTELLHRDPAVYLFHDVISDEEIRNIQLLSRPLLKRSVIIFPHQSTHHITAASRISKTAWLEDDMSEVMTRITQRIEDLTGIPSIYGEELQIVNYGVGGHFAPHYDASEDNRRDFIKRRDRLATLMFYPHESARTSGAVTEIGLEADDAGYDESLSNVEQGGATVFLEMNLTVFPIKNAAISWLNLLPSGKLDVRTLHGSCPVLRGSKWVATKWLHRLNKKPF